MRSAQWGMPRAARAESPHHNKILIWLVIAIAALAIAPMERAETASTPSFVGAAACGGCHQRELALWNGSHHQLAMEIATASSVLGNFNNAQREIRRSHLAPLPARRQEFIVRTDGADGKLQDFEIKFTFGASPLQQYLIAMPGGQPASARHRVGQPAARQRRSALVPALPGK